MGNKPPKQNTEWTEEMNQYIVKNYLLKGIRAVAKDLGRTKDAVRSHISTLRNEGYFDNMFDGLPGLYIIQLLGMKTIQLNRAV